MILLDTALEKLEADGRPIRVGIIGIGFMGRAIGLPNGLAEDCVLTRDVPKDQAVTFDDVELPPGRLCDELWREQCERFADELR
jgi:predicted homoserine dehydrogenase-like protein